VTRPAHRPSEPPRPSAAPRSGRGTPLALAPVDGRTPTCAGQCRELRRFVFAQVTGRIAWVATVGRHQSCRGFAWLIARSGLSCVRGLGNFVRFIGFAVGGFLVVVAVSGIPSLFGTGDLALWGLVAGSGVSILLWTWSVAGGASR
jgi:hypothetical protein